MPWELRKKGSQTCVHKKGSSSPVPGGCHSSRADAIKHQRALYAAERRKGGGMGTTEGTQEAVSISFTGHLDGEDLVLIGENGKEVARHPVLELAQADRDTDLVRWEGPLGLEGYATSDGRYLIPGEISERSLPLPLNVQLLTDEGHKNSANAGRLESLSRIPVGEFDRRDEFGLTDVPDDVVVIWGEGTFDGSEAATEAQRMLANGSGISLDLPPDRHGLFDRETLEEIDPEADGVTLEDVMSGKYLQGMGGKIAGATVVTIPAFEHAMIQVTDGHALVAAGMPIKFFRIRKKEVVDGVPTTWIDTVIPDPEPALVAAAAIRKPPRDWLDNPNLNAPTPLTYTDDGRVYGHLAPWNGCHTGYGGVCIPPPRSARDYALFNVGLVECDNNEEVPCGKLMYSRDGGKHANPYSSAAAAAKEYDNATCVAGYVRAGADRHGIWLAGFLSDDLTADDIQFLKAHPPSGDWRPIGSADDKELVAAFCVPVPGFPIPHAMVASAGEEVASIILGPWSPEEVQPREYRRRVATLSRRRKG